MNKAVFLDRDGTINYDKGYTYRIKDLSLLDNAQKGIWILNELGYLVIVVSNQSGVGRGFFSETDVKIFNRELNDKLSNYNAHIDNFYFCPHYIGSLEKRYNIECDCRKPKPGMIFNAAKDYNIDLKNSYIIGDKESDYIAGMSAGLKKGFIINKEYSLYDCIRENFEIMI